MTDNMTEKGVQSQEHAPVHDISNQEKTGQLGVPGNENITSSNTSTLSLEKGGNDRRSSEFAKVQTAQSMRDDNAITRKTTTATSTDKMPHGFKLVAIVVALALSIFLVSLDMTIVSTAIPQITNEFQSLPDVGWYGSAFFLTVGSFQALWGKVYKYLPLKTSYLISILIFEIGSLICAVAPNSVTLILGRAIAGIGGAGIASGSYTLMAFAAPPEKRAAFTGFMGATYGIASVVGPILGGVFTEHATWRWCFYVNLPVGGAAAVIIFLTFTTPENAKPQPATWRERLLQFDLPGTFIVMSAVICFLLAIQWGGSTKSWNDKDVIGCLVGFALLIIVFGLVEKFSGDRAMIQGRLLRSRAMAMACAYIFFFAGSFFLILYQLPLYFQSVQGVGASDSGVRTIPLLVAASLFSIVSGGLITVKGYYQPFLLLGGALNAIGAGLLYKLDIDASAGQWIGYQIVAGVGIGFGIQTSIIVGQASVSNADLSTATAMILFFQTIGGAFFVQGGQSAFTNKLLKTLAYTAPGVSAYQVLNTGASNLRKAFSGAQLNGILQAWLEGQRDAYILAIVLAAISFVVACAAPWQSIKGKMAQAAGAA